MGAADLRLPQLQRKAGCDCRVRVLDTMSGQVCLMHPGKPPILVRPEGEWVNTLIERLRRAHDNA